MTDLHGHRASCEESVTGYHGSIQYQQLDGSAVITPELVQPCVRYRYVVSVLALFGFFMAHATRSFFTITLVAMVNFTEEPVTINGTGKGCPGIKLNYTPAFQQEGEFQWHPDIQAVLLGGFFYGYVVTQLPGGYLADRFGGARVFGVAVALPGALNLLMPTLARWDYRLLLASRILSGLIQGPLYPSNQSIWSKWAPELERSRLTVLALSGASAGVVVSNVMTGYLCSLPYLGGWPLPFYVFGGASCLWWVLWMTLSSDVPSKSRWVSAAELEHIERGTNCLDQRKYTAPRVLSLFASRAVWGLWIYMLCDGLGFYVVFNTLPIYLKQVLGFDLSQNGIVSALPPLLCFFICFVAGPTSDAAVKRWPQSKTTIRKVFTGFGEGCMAVALLVIGLSDCNHVVVVSVLVVGYGLNAFVAGGIGVINMDMAPQHAGLLLGITNTVANFGGFLSPVIVDAITGNQDDRKAWQLVFYLMSATYGVGILAFLALGSAEVEPWAKLPEGEADVDLLSSNQSHTNPFLGNQEQNFQPQGNVENNSHQDNLEHNS